MDSRHRARNRGAADEGGFTVIELMVASAIILTAMVSLAFVLTGTLTDVAFGKQRQIATDLMDQAMEQVRALPFNTVQLGLDPTNDSTFATDSAISGTPKQYGSETLLFSSRAASYSQVPLVPHETKALLNSSNYTVDVYPTDYQGNHAVLRVTVVVKWSNSLRGGVAAQVSSQSLLYSPTLGCLAESTHPFAAPCQPFLYAAASSGSGAVSITPAVGTQPFGIALVSAQLTLPQANSTMQVEQVSSVNTAFQTSAVAINTGTSLLNGGTLAAAAADNDPGTVSAIGVTQSASQISPFIATANAPQGSLTLTADGGDTGSATSAASSGSGPACNDLATSPALVNTGLPCGNAIGGHTGSTTLGAIASFTAGTLPVTADLADVTESLGAFTGRAIAANTSSFCRTTTGDGCVRAGVQRTISKAAFGSLPSGMADTGFTSYVKLTTPLASAGFAESGVTPMRFTPTNPATTMQVYNLATHAYVALVAGGTNPAYTQTATVIAGQSLTVDMSLANVVLGSASSTPSDCTTLPAASPGSACSVAITSPMTGDLTYTLTLNTSVIASLVIHIDLGALSAQTSYRAGLSAG